MVQLGLNHFSLQRVRYSTSMKRDECVGVRNNFDRVFDGTHLLYSSQIIPLWIAFRPCDVTEQ